MAIVSVHVQMTQLIIRSTLAESAVIAPSLQMHRLRFREVYANFFEVKRHVSDEAGDKTQGSQ